MSKSIKKAEEILKLIEEGESIEDIKNKVASSKDEWFKYSSKAYKLAFEKAEKERKEKALENFSTKASNDQINTISKINNELSNYGLLLNIFTTHEEAGRIKNLLEDFPRNASAIFQIIEKITMDSRIRALQKEGRIKQFPYFKDFTRLIDSSTLSYYRNNFIACYLTLIPIIEGLIIRWMGYSEGVSKPDFEDIRKFFKKSHLRQPNPNNIIFHKVYIEVCDEIINQHLFKPTSAGPAYNNYNRHIASHLLSNDVFATKENCLRLFILIDAMTEIYYYESKVRDPRFSLSDDNISEVKELYENILNIQEPNSPENILLNSK